MTLSTTLHLIKFVNVSNASNLDMFVRTFDLISVGRSRTHLKNVLVLRELENIFLIFLRLSFDLLVNLHLRWVKFDSFLGFIDLKKR